MPQRNYVTRREYDAWISECAALAVACGYPVQDDMINDNTGLVFGDDQYEAFAPGMWSREPFEVFAIFQALNEPAVEGLPEGSMEWAQFGGLCDKLMIVHPGKFCSPHLHWRKTEFYEVVLGEMELYYAPEIIDDKRLQVSRAGLIYTQPMPRGERRPAGTALPKGREHTYDLLTEYRKLRPGEPKFVMHRKHLHAFGCPRDARTPVVIREGSAYSHEPTATGKSSILSDWRHIHDNGFLLEGLDEGRLKNNIRES
jgi:hypothetical protein